VQQLALFDLDDTLVDRRAAFTAWAAEFCTDRGLGQDGYALLLVADAQRRGPRRAFFDVVRDRLAPAESVDQLWGQYRRRMPELVTCREEDLAALAELREAGWLLGIVTNGMTDNQSAKIRRTRLDTLMHGWAISDKIGIRKPHPDLFRHAARQCGADLTCGGWMTGDDLHLDISGGHAAGLRTIWLAHDERNLEPPHTTPSPDHRARSIPEAVTILLNTR
jgi:HAD superfamily hydrolase (TIGR01549 family)